MCELSNVLIWQILLPFDETILAKLCPNVKLLPNWKCLCGKTGPLKNKYLSFRSPRQSQWTSSGPQRDPGCGAGGFEPLQKPLQVLSHFDIILTTSPFLLPEGRACISVKNDSVIFKNKKHPESAVPHRGCYMKYVSACADFPAPVRIAVLPCELGSFRWVLSVGQQIFELVFVGSRHVFYFTHF